MSDPKELLAAVREEARPGIWSQGVGLSRNGAVALQSRSGSEIELRVRVAGRPVPWTVVLYPEDLSWECDCPSKVDPCEHVVAAANALEKSEREEGGKALETTEQKFARIVYRFARADGGLTLQRVVAQADGTQTPLEDSLTAILARPVQAAQYQLEQSDLRADRVLVNQRRGVLRSDDLALLFEVLQGSRNVLLDGRPVVLSDEVILPRAVITDEGEQIVLTMLRDPRVTEVVSPGVALCGDALCRLGSLDETGASLERLPLRRSWSAAQAAEFATRVLPALSDTMNVELRTRRVPAIDKSLEPRIVLELNQIDAGLSVLPTLVYGAPPHVRIDAGRMVYVKGAVPRRDEAKEQRLVHQLRDELNLVPGRRMTLTGKDVSPFVDKLRKWQGGMSGDAGRLLNPNARLKPSLQVIPGELNGRPDIRFALDFELEGGAKGEGGKVDAAAVLRAWQDGLDIVPIEGGGWAPLPRAWLEKQGHLVADLLAARGADGQVAAHALPQLAALCDQLDQPPPPGLDRLRPLIEGFTALPEAELPKDLTATLRPYQLLGVRWIQFLRSAGLGGILADDMGLGKTLQTICALGPKTLVVCPTSVLPNWRAEIERFRPSLKVAVYHGPGRALDESADVTLTTYAILRLDQAQLTAKTWSTVVLDEAQAIKNPESQAARAAYALKGELRLALSGTPIENRLDELWSLMHFVNPGLLGGRRDFGDRFADPIADGNRSVADGLRRRIRPFVLRRLKSEVAKELPPRSEAVLRVELDERERAVYDAVYQTTRKEVLALLGEGGGVMKALEALLRLRQAACHIALLPGQVASTSSKVERLVEALQTAVADGHKALVFSQWTSLLDLLEPALKGADVSFERLDGSTVDREGVTTRFQSPDGAPVMLISLKAGGTGLNLTAADHVFLIDPWWNPAVEAQAADRAHRIGQERPVFVYRMIAQGTVEERILKLQDKKRALFEAALGDGGAGAGLTKDDLAELLA